MSKSRFIIAAVASLFSGQAFGADYLYNHNGSTMRLEQEGRSVRIYYQNPRNGLNKIGVRVGTLLFDGKVDQGYLDGMIQLFSSRCGDIDYFVYGDFRAGRSFKLTGASPVRGKNSCKIIDNTYDGSNSNLVFQALGGGGNQQQNNNNSQQQHNQQVAVGCVKGIAAGSWLNVRVGPGGKYGKINQLRAGTCDVKIDSASCQGSWCAIEYGNVRGWVHMNYLQR